MSFLKVGAVLGVAASLVTGWHFVQPRGGLGVGSSGSSATPVTYYVSPAGRNTATGTSPATAWRTLARASKAALLPGTRLLLRGGHQYSGQLRLGAADGGNPRKPVLISTYGTGRATISSSSSAIVVIDTGGITIRGLTIVGQHAMSPANSGIQMYSDRTTGMFGHVFVDRVNISGFGYGIALGAAHDGAGFANVRITNSALHGNLDAGLISYGPDYNPKAPGYANHGIYVSHVRAFRNLGDPANTTRNTGSGIELGSVASATVVNSQAYQNGGKGGATREGPIGIWAYDSTRVLLAHDVSHDNTSASVHDGGGFGLDRETSDSVMEYNLSYHNHGAGFLLYSALNAPAPQRNNVVRFNLSYGDATGGHHVYGAMTAGGWVDNGTFYQNTIILARGNKQPVVKLTGILHHVRMFNNILVAASGPVVEVVPPLNKALAHPMTTADALLAGNDYRATAGPLFVQWGLKTEYFSIGAWRAATGEEKAAGKAVGLTLNPLFAGPLSGPRGAAGFVLRKGSPLIGAGLNLKLLFGITAGKVDFAGKPYSVTRPNIGAM
ncbi:MAG TPA: right-handed parallel beta-helix repeat-containing protein [Streptosporangiaceae bacterium]